MTARKPGRPKTELTPEQEQQLALAELLYNDYQKSKKLAPQEVKRQIEERRRLAAKAVRQLRDSGVPPTRISARLTNRRDTKIITRLLEEGAENNG